MNENNKNGKNKIFKDNPNIIFKKKVSIQNELSSETVSIEKFDFFILNKIAYIAIPNYL